MIEDLYEVQLEGSDIGDDNMVPVIIVYREPITSNIASIYGYVSEN